MEPFSLRHKYDVSEDIRGQEICLTLKENMKHAIKLRPDSLTKGSERQEINRKFSTFKYTLISVIKK